MLIYCSVSCVLTGFSLWIIRTGAVDIVSCNYERLFLFSVVPPCAFSLTIGEYTSGVAYLLPKLKTSSLSLALSLCLWEYHFFRIYSRASDMVQWEAVLGYQAWGHCAQTPFFHPPVWQVERHPLTTRIVMTTAGHHCQPWSYWISHGCIWNIVFLPLLALWKNS